MLTPLIGAGLCAVLFWIGWLAGSSVLVGLLVSLAFGSTAFVTISAAGGASPLVYVVFEMAVCFTVVVRPTLGRDLAAVFAQGWEVWAALALLIYAPATAYLLPRLFEGSVDAFVATRDVGVVEVALAPTSGNITQTGYFCLGILTFFAVSCLLVQPGRLPILRRGYVAWATCVAAGGLVDLGGKSAGLGDLLAPIRTAAFAYLTNTEQAGFYRIAGSFSEASSFATSAVAALGFCFTDWRLTRSRLTGALAVVLFALLALSTSSTAYGGLVCLGLLLTFSIVRNACVGRLTLSDVLLVVGGVAAVTVALAFAAHDERLTQPFQDLIQVSLIDKMSSESGQERTYWNQHSLMTVPETGGLGIGFGSSRASNWLVAVVSQLGVIGTLLQVSLLIPLARPLARRGCAAARASAAGFHTSLRACAFSLIVGAVLAGGSADPGALFFISLAGILACRPYAQIERTRSAGRAFGPLPLHPAR